MLVAAAAARRRLFRLDRHVGAGAEQLHVQASASTAPPMPSYVCLTNDDGPPNDEHSPFISAFAPQLAEWIGAEKLLVCLPERQQSWRGKAHIPQESANVTSPAIALPEKWFFVSGTPAAAANLAVNTLAPLHFASAALRGGEPLVISGPNFGDNAGRSYMLSSGTLGAALEASISSGHRAVALSFAQSKTVRNTRKSRRALRLCASMRSAALLHLLSISMVQH
jgi:5'/3'-nucleotidase SurE